MNAAKLAARVQSIPAPNRVSQLIALALVALSVAFSALFTVRSVQVDRARDALVSAIIDARGQATPAAAREWTALATRVHYWRAWPWRPVAVWARALLFREDT